MTYKNALKIIKRYIELKTKVEERSFCITGFDELRYNIVYDKLKEIEKKYEKSENKRK